MLLYYINIMILTLVRDKLNKVLSLSWAFSGFAMTADIRKKIDSIMRKRRIKRSEPLQHGKFVWRKSKRCPSFLFATVLKYIYHIMMKYIILWWNMVKNHVYTSYYFFKHIILNWRTTIWIIWLVRVASSKHGLNQIFMFSRNNIITNILLDRWIDRLLVLLPRVKNHQFQLFSGKN